MIAIIAALGENNAIGLKNGLPWRLSADLRHFKEITTGHAVIMGTRTHDSIGRTLPERRNIVLSNNPNYEAKEGSEIADSLPGALLKCSGEDSFIIGGASVFKEALPIADKLFLTRVHASPEADVFFPDINSSDWKLVSEENHPADEKNEHPYTFQVYEKIRA